MSALLFFVLRTGIPRVQILPLSLLLKSLTISEKFSLLTIVSFIDHDPFRIL